MSCATLSTFSNHGSYYVASRRCSITHANTGQRTLNRVHISFDKSSTGMFTHIQRNIIGIRWRRWRRRRSRGWSRCWTRGIGWDGRDRRSICSRWRGCHRRRHGWRVGCGGRVRASRRPRRRKTARRRARRQRRLEWIDGNLRIDCHDAISGYRHQNQSNYNQGPDLKNIILVFIHSNPAEFRINKFMN